MQLNTEETEISESKEYSEVFSKFFASVAKSVLMKNPNTQNPKFKRPVDSSMFFAETILSKLMGEIERFKLSASRGADLLSNKHFTTDLNNLIKNCS